MWTTKAQTCAKSFVYKPRFFVKCVPGVFNSRDELVEFLKQEGFYSEQADSFMRVDTGIVSVIGMEFFEGTMMRADLFQEFVYHTKYQLKTYLIRYRQFCQELNSGLALVMPIHYKEEEHILFYSRGVVLLNGFLYTVHEVTDKIAKGEPFGSWVTQLQADQTVKIGCFVLTKSAIDQLLHEVR